MKSLNRSLFLVTFTLCVLALAGIITADPSALRNHDGGPVGEFTGDLPAVPRGPMTQTQGIEGTQVLSFDDGTCEGGLGAGVTVTDLVDFDVPTQCIQGGLDIVGLTARMNTGTATAFAFGQSGATPPAAGAVNTAAMAAIAGVGPCPGTSLVSRAVGPGAAVITGTSNFFAGLRTPNGFAGRDTNSPAAGRIWLLCAGCGMTQYSPTDLSGIGLGGNWNIRVTVEDANCIPVELMDFMVSDG